MKTSEKFLRKLAGAKEPVDCLRQRAVFGSEHSEVAFYPFGQEAFAVAAGEAVVEENDGCLVLQRSDGSPRTLRRLLHGGQHIAVFASVPWKMLIIVFDLCFYSGRGFRIRHTNNNH